MPPKQQYYTCGEFVYPQEYTVFHPDKDNSYLFTRGGKLYQISRHPYKRFQDTTFQTQATRALCREIASITPLQSLFCTFGSDGYIELWRRAILVTLRFIPF